MANKIDEYISAESQAQFSDSKREIIESRKLGYSVMSDATKKAYEMSKLKNRSVSNCEWCKKPYVELNSRKELKLCSLCEPGRTTIEDYLTKHKQQHLTQSDAQRISDSKTTRRGPFYYGKQPK